MKRSFEESEGDQCYRHKAKHNYRDTKQPFTTHE